MNGNSPLKTARTVFLPDPEQLRNLIDEVANTHDIVVPSWRQIDAIQPGFTRMVAAAEGAGNSNLIRCRRR